MTKDPKICKADIIKVALELLKAESLDDLTTRQIAVELKCSVQPIFYNFDNMDDLRREALASITAIYHEYMLEGSKEARPYLGMGMAYIKFARDFPNYFRILFMSKTDLTPDLFLTQDDIDDNLLQEGMKATGFGLDEQKHFHLKVWIFTHGLAALVANGTVQIGDDEIRQILQETVHEMLIGAKQDYSTGVKHE